MTALKVGELHIKHYFDEFCDLLNVASKDGLVTAQTPAEAVVTCFGK